MALDTESVAPVRVWKDHIGVFTIAIVVLAFSSAEIIIEHESLDTLLFSPRGFLLCTHGDREARVGWHVYGTRLAIDFSE